MKNIIFVLKIIMPVVILFFLSGNIYSQEFSVKEKKHVKENSISARLSYSSNGTNTYKIIYDKEGNIIEELSLDKNGNVESKYVFEYEYGILIKETKYKNDNISMVTTYKPEINMSGYLVKLNGYINDKFDGYYLFTYNSDTLLVEHKFFDKSDNLYAKYIFEYDYTGKMKTEKDIFYLKDKIVTMFQEYKYDYKGNKIQNDWYVDDDNVKHTTTYKYEYLE